jgi:hypothetical protein
MKPHTQSRNPHQRPAPLPSTHQVPPAVHESRVSNHESQITYNCSHQLLTFLINAAPIRNARIPQKTNNGGDF